MRSALRWISLAAFALPWVLPAVNGQAPATPAEPPSLLRDAFNKLMENQGRWAYTQTQEIAGLTAGLRRETILRVDPSKAYTEQFRPLQIEGAPPTAGQLDEFRGVGERVAKKRLRDQGDTKEHTGDELKISLNLQVVTPDLVHATVAAEDGESVTYEVPLRTTGGGGAAFDAFQVTARVSRQRREFEHATIRQRAPMRVEVLARVTDAEIDCEFTSVDPRFPSVITSETQKATVRVLFVKRAISFEMKRTDFSHVTPYDERFGVKLGPIRTIQF